MLYLGLVAGVVAGNLAAHAAHIDAFRVYVATLILIVPTIAGTRVLFVAVHWPLYRSNLRRIFNTREGGLLMYGGLPVMLLLSVPLLAALRLELGAFWDVATFTILVGMIFTRLGCLLNGCCAGRPSASWLGIYLPNEKGEWKRRIPTQVLEAIWAAVILMVAVVIWGRMPFAGALFLFVSASYAGGRFVMEFARERAPRARSFTLGHAISLVTLILSVSALAVSWRQ
jgi:prolipoprotein diacylglyceryltransferase